jgi:hypothetical protein
MTTPDNSNAATTVASGQPFPNDHDRSAMSASALRAAAQADEIPVEGKWGPAWTLILIIGGSAGLWGLIALVKILFF